jgi:hypothetical protein
MPKEITLATPLKVGGEEVSVLKLRDPKARDFRALTSLDRPFAAMLDLAASLSDLPAAVLDEMGPEDTMAVVEAVSGFLPQSLPTGKK